MFEAKEHAWKQANGWEVKEVSSILKERGLYGETIYVYKIRKIQSTI